VHTACEDAPHELIVRAVRWAGGGHGQGVAEELPASREAGRGTAFQTL
jgi:hypothetical protein